jgi:S-adenosylhomocysteine hydrolase
MSLRNCFARLLDQTAHFYERQRDSIYICGLQHIVPSQEQLFGAIKESRIAHGRPIIVGKHYSTVQQALPPEHYSVNDLQEIIYTRGHFEAAFKAKLDSWCHDLVNTVVNGKHKKVVILDDGGYVSGFLVEKFLEHNCRVVVVEQTTSGLKYARNYPCPVVTVANSILKREVESIFIAESILQALARKKILIRSGVKCGIIGFGAVGTALCRELKKRGVKKIFVFDRNGERQTAAANEGFTILPNAKSFIEQSDLVFGCTGKDVGEIIKPTAVRRSEKELLCVSCGSGDGEFASWISSPQQVRVYRRGGRICGNGLDDIDGQFGSGNFRVLNGGFPVNLDRSAKSDPVDDFVLTRMLVFCGILQAIKLAGEDCSSKNKVVALQKDLELAVHKVWFDAYPKRLPNDIKTSTEALLMSRVKKKPAR